MTSRLRTLLGCAALLLASAFTAGVASAQTQVTLTMPGCATLTAPSTQGSTITVTCNTGVAPPGSPTCSGANLALVGTTLTFAATCTKGTNAITSITLSSGQTFCSAATTPCAATSTIAVSIPGIAVPAVSTTYTVTASDGSLTGTASAFYSVSGGGGGAVDLSACTALGYTNSAYYDSAYPTGLPINISNVFHQGVPSGMPFGNTAALVVRFTTPALGVNDNTQPNFQVWTTSTGRQMTIGEAPCLVPQANSVVPADASSPQRPVLKTVLSPTPATYVDITANGLCNLGTGCANTSHVFLKPNTTDYITLVNKTPQWNV